MVLTTTVWKLQGIILASGAVFNLTETAEIAVLNCFMVEIEAELNLDAANANASAGPGFGFFPPDPSVLNVDCSMMPGGWSPRLCGPGQLVVYGKVNILSLYAGVFSNTYVEPTGVLSVSFLFGTFLGYLENYGKVEQVGYIFGSIVNYGFMSGTGGQFALPMYLDSFVNITNHGELHFSGNSGGYQSYLTNFGTVVISNPQNVFFLEISNHGNLTLRYAMSGVMPFIGMYIQSVINTKLMLADAANVYINRYVSVSGTTKTINDGSFTFGNGAGVKDAGVRASPQRECDEEGWRAVEEEELALRAERKQM